MAGIARIRALAAHQFARGSFRLRPCRARNVITIPVRTLVNAMITASKPRVRQPRTETGVATTAKNSSGAKEGKTI